MIQTLRPATKLAGLFASIGLAITVIGVSGGFDSAPTLWREAWPLAAAVELALGILVGYYVFRSGGAKI